ncbi:MAG: hypothetical protein M1831_003103 [Alyxoria varia]|nr:MAG: hypothetical protein M1831_003103 [Alyxoria varia]
MNEEDELHVPSQLEDITFKQFDDLVQQNKIFYEDAPSELTAQNGFTFEFRIVDMLKNKPILARDAPGRSTASGPFIDPNPEEAICTLENTHRLMFNKFCIYRPMLVLPTVRYELQTDDLTIQDMRATWAVLKAYKRMPMMAVYNCGVDAGSSQGHKHLQVFPLPAHELWPARAKDSAIAQEDGDVSPSVYTGKVDSSIPSVPFQHFVLRIPPHSTAAQVHQMYGVLLLLSRDAQESAGVLSRDYNVAMTDSWIVVIPRTTAVNGGPFGANAAGMLGLVSVRDQQERDKWAELGYTAYLRRLGVA